MEFNIEYPKDIIVGRLKYPGRALPVTLHPDHDKEIGQVQKIHGLGDVLTFNIIFHSAFNQQLIKDKIAWLRVGPEDQVNGVCFKDPTDL
jgi:hypothetical protein